MKWYSFEPLVKKYDPQYIITFGRRNRGKSWDAKTRVLKRFCKNGERFVYIRRYSTDLTRAKALRYWARFQSEGGFDKAVNGKYETIEAQANEFYLVRHDEKGRAVKDLAGYYIDLNGATHWKSQEFPNVATIIFEEFITNDVYIEDEPNEFMNLVSTIARGDTNVLVLMIGNTISRVCPYFYDWGIGNLIEQEQGTVKVFNMLNEETGANTRIVCERTYDKETTEKEGGKTLFFGNSAKSITLGEWEVKPVPTRPRGTYKTHYEVRVKMMYMDFILQLQSGEDEQPFLFIYTNKFHRNTIPPRTLENVFATDPTITKYFRDEIPAERIMCDLWRGGRFCFSDRLTGNDFLQAMEQSKFVFDTHTYTL